MRRSTAKVLMLLNLAAMVVLIIAFHKVEGASFLIALVCLVIAAILSHWLRCPSCGRGQGRNWLLAEYCPFCGEYLDDNG